MPTTTRSTRSREKPEQIADELRAMIVSGQLQEGESLGREPDLVERFETRKLVDRAKGLLNEKMGLTEPEAFRWIQKASMDRRLTMHDVAKAIIEQLSAKK